MGGRFAARENMSIRSRKTVKVHLLGRVQGKVVKDHVQ